MPRRRSYYRHSWDGRDWAAWHDRKRSHVSSRFFGLDADVRDRFFRLSTRQLQLVFESYGREYGQSARQYAARTYVKWQSGEVNPSAETLERLLQRVPEVLPIHERAALLALLRRRSRRIPTKRVTCSPADAEAMVSTELTTLLMEGLRHETPPHVKSALDWLACDSMMAAETILRIGEVLSARSPVSRGGR